MIRFIKDQIIPRLAMVGLGLTVLVVGMYSPNNCLARLTQVLVARLKGG